MSVSGNEIIDFWNAHRDDPEAIRNAMAQYGVDVGTAAYYTGQDQQALQNYLYGTQQQLGWFNDAAPTTKFTDYGDTPRAAPTVDLKKNVARLPTLEEFKASIKPGQLDAQGRFNAPIAGVNFMLEGMTPEQAYAAATGYNNYRNTDFSSPTYPGDVHSSPNLQLLDTSWRTGPDNGGGVLGGIARSVGNLATGIAHNPALMAAFTAGVVNPAISSASSALPSGVSQALNMPGVSNGITTLLTTGDPNRALRAGALGALTNSATNYVAGELGAQDLIPIQQSTADAMAKTGMGFVTGGVRGGINNLISAVGNSGAKSKKPAVDGDGSSGGDGTPDAQEEDGDYGFDADLDLGTKTITATKPSDPWEFPMPDKIDVPFPELNIEEDPTQLPTVVVRGKRELEPVPFTAMDPEYPELPPVELNIAPDIPPPDKKVTIPKVPVSTTKPTLPSIPTSPSKPAPATGTAPSTGVGSGAGSGLYGVSPLAKVFYAGKKFTGQEKRVDAHGNMLDDKYTPLSVTKAGAELHLPSNETVADVDETKENPVGPLRAALGLPDPAYMAALFGDDDA